jgi:SAM-dependent methyltransferase
VRAVRHSSEHRWNARPRNGSVAAPGGGDVTRARYLTGDAREVLATLEPDSVDLIVSSPPFLALRDYLPADHPDKAKEIGSERTPGVFLNVLLDVVEACARVLAQHGSLVFELGDTYAGSGGENHLYEGSNPVGGFNGSAAMGSLPTPRRDISRGWPLAKSKCMIPQLFAVALAYGINPLTGRTTPQWIVRNIVAWCRPNPPVGADGDKFRPATSYVTVACKNAQRYWDGDAVRTPLLGDPTVGGQPRRATFPAESRTHDERPSAIVANPAGAPRLDYWEIPTHAYAGAHYATWPPALVVPLVKAMCPHKVCRTCGQPSRRIVEHSHALEESRPQARRAMQLVEDAGLTEAHLAAIRATGITGSSVKAAHTQKGYAGNTAEVQRLSAEARHVLGGYYCEFVRGNPETVGWSDCGHDNWRTGLVLDPFAGTGVTLAVATGHGRDAIGIDLDERNAELARERVGPLLLDVIPKRRAGGRARRRRQA